MAKLGRRRVLRGAAGAACLPWGIARAAEKVLVIGMSVPLTGALARQAKIASTAAQFAVDQANSRGGAGGYRIKLMVLDDGSSNTGQYDPALSATNARRMVTDPLVIAAVGPMNSGSAKAMAPIFSQADIAFISGSATNPDLNDPKFWSLYHPGGKPNFFRTVTTDAYQGRGWRTTSPRC
jgi:branched-chain amino acid transport system substrate-binding protein